MGAREYIIIGTVAAFVIVLLWAVIGSINSWTK